MGWSIDPSSGKPFFDGDDDEGEHFDIGDLADIAYDELTASYVNCDHIVMAECRAQEGPALELDDAA